MKIYSSKDFYLTSFLMSRNIQLHNHFREGPVTIFEFQSTPELRKLVDLYYTDNALVNPLRYGSSIRNLKSILHNYANTSGANTNEALNNETKQSEGNK